MEISLYNKEGIYLILQQMSSCIKKFKINMFYYKAEKSILSRIGFNINKERLLKAPSNNSYMEVFIP